MTDMPTPAAADVDLGKEINRLDGWMNILTGLGVKERDARKSNSYGFEKLDPETLRVLWRGDDLCGKIVEKPAFEMVRKGFEVKVQPDQEGEGYGEETPEEAPRELERAQVGQRRDAFPPGMPPGLAPPPKAPPKPIKKRGEDTKKIAEAAQAKHETLKTSKAFLQGLQYARAYGGAGILIGAEDGAKDLKEPLKLDRIKSVKFLTVLSARELYATAYYNDPRAEKFGLPELYRIQPIAVGHSAKGTYPATLTGSVEVHETRLLIFQGVEVGRDQLIENQGWGDSVLQRCHEIVSDYQMSWHSAALLVKDFAQAVLQIKGLAALIAQDKDGVVIKRAQLLDLMRSVARMIMIDEGESYERKATPITGLRELLQEMGTRLAAAADMPVTFLFGVSPAGLNATGESDRISWYDRIASMQESELREPLEYLTRLIFLAKDGPTKGVEPQNWSVCFKPLLQLTELEQATLRKTQADVDNIYIQASVVTPEEIAASRFGGDAYSTDTVIDFEGREEMTKAFEEEEAERQAEQEEQLEELQEQEPEEGAPARARPGF